MLIMKNSCHKLGAYSKLMQCKPHTHKQREREREGERGREREHSVASNLVCTVCSGLSIRILRVNRYKYSLSRGKSYLSINIVKMKIVILQTGRTKARLHGFAVLFARKIYRYTVA